jgi:peptide chain release factor 2
MPQSERTELLKHVRHLMTLFSDWKAFVSDYDELETGLSLVQDEHDAALEAELRQVAERLDKRTAHLEVQNLLSGENDDKNAIVLIHSGAGGTESADWAAMLFRMYQRWAEIHRFKVEMMDYQPGEEAGLKSVTFEIVGDYAYGHLKTEGGVHRLVRISPFDSNKRRHTSFASVFVYPDIEETAAIQINESDLKVDTYRASGAGGQHVNTTDSAIRITHLPTGIVVTCQNERSQHKNKSLAMKVLKAKLYEKQQAELNAERDKLNAQKQRIAWGSQIRSYVLHPYQLVKDHRTDYETSQSAKVLDGEIDGFIEAALVKKVV